ncbi:MAG: hypothetical protein SGPRY_001041 [Prymnesium sp.]
MRTFARRVGEEQRAATRLGKDPMVNGRAQLKLSSFLFNLSNHEETYHHVQPRHTAEQIRRHERIRRWTTGEMMLKDSFSDG